MFVAQTYSESGIHNFYYLNNVKNQWIAFDPNKIGHSVEEVSKFAAYSIGGTLLTVGALEVFGAAFIAEEIGENVFEAITGIPFIMNPLDILEYGYKKVLRNQVKEKIIEKYGKDKLEDMGSYTIKYSDGTSYHGKGPFEEAVNAAARKSKNENDTVINFDWTPSSKNTNIDGFIDEARRLNKDGTYQNPLNRNQRDSSGNRKYKEDYKKKYGDE